MLDSLDPDRPDILSGLIWVQTDPDQALYFIRPDLGPNCLQKLSADGFSRYRVKHKTMIIS